MPRKNLIRTNQFPYHVTIRCNNKEWFDLPLQTVYRICIQCISKASKKYPVNIQAFVLMSNHYHLLIWTPNANLDKFMFEFNRNISIQIRARTGRINRIFGDRYKWSLIQNELYYARVLKYIYQNPLELKGIKKCENYKFSTLNSFVFKKALPFKLFDPILDYSMERFLIWVNESSTQSYNYKTKIAITRPIFRLPSKKTMIRNYG